MLCSFYFQPFIYNQPLTTLPLTFEVPREGLPWISTRSTSGFNVSGAFFAGSLDLAPASALGASDFTGLDSVLAASLGGAATPTFGAAAAGAAGAAAAAGFAAAAGAAAGLAAAGAAAAGGLGAAVFGASVAGFLAMADEGACGTNDIIWQILNSNENTYSFL
jgi:hypothetical protein